jgi:hypothetical protein
MRKNRFFAQLIAVVAVFVLCAFVPLGPTGVGSYPSAGPASFLSLTGLFGGSMHIFAASRAPLTTVTLRPSAYVALTSPVGFSNPTYAYDNNSSTASSVNIVVPNKSALAREELWEGFPARPSGATGLTLYVTASAAVGPGATGTLGTAGLISNKTLISLTQHGSVSEQTFSVPLSDTQNLQNIQIDARCFAQNAGTAPGVSSTCAMSIYEIWVSN